MQFRKYLKFGNTKKILKIKRNIPSTKIRNKRALESSVDFFMLKQKFLPKMYEIKWAWS